MKWLGEHVPTLTWAIWACAMTYIVFQAMRINAQVLTELGLLRDAVLRNTHAHIAHDHRTDACPVAHRHPDKIPCPNCAGAVIRPTPLRAL
jgi:hypothetical protein